MEETQRLPEKTTAPPAAMEKEPEKVETPVAPPPHAAPIVRQPAVAAERAPKAGEGGATFQIVISSPNNEVQVGADARVVISLQNLAEHQILFAHRPGTNNPEFSYTIRVRNAAGRVVEETAYGSQARLQQTEARTVDYVQPGQSTAQTAHLTRLVNLSRPGEYRVRVSRKDPETQVVVESNEITLDVVP